MERVVTTPDGRRLRVVEGGDPTGVPVVVHHGTPGAGSFYEPHERDARSRGIRLIGYDRPGYGGSTQNSGRSIGSCAEDVRAIASALEVKRMAVWGFSGGGPHAIACAALLPDLLVAAGSLASMAPYGVDGFDFYAGMGEGNVESIRQMLDDEPGARAQLVTDREQMLSRSAAQMRDAFPTLLSPVDREARTPELMDWLHRTMHEGLAPGGEGWWDDGVAEISPWGFDLASIRVPLQLWHGRHDRFVPFQHGEWLASRIPGVEAHLTDEDGHLTLVQHRIGQLHAWLLEHF